MIKHKCDEIEDKRRLKNGNKRDGIKYRTIIQAMLWEVYKQKINLVNTNKMIIKESNEIEDKRRRGKRNDL